jgi:hypothetical protein
VTVTQGVSGSGSSDRLRRLRLLQSQCKLRFILVLVHHGISMLGGGDLGLVRVHVRGERGARHVDVRLEAGVGVVREEVPVVTGVNEHHNIVRHVELSLELLAHFHLRIVVLGGPLLHGITQG